MCDAEKMPFRESGFDIILCRYVLHHFPDPIPILEECEKILKKGGKIVIVESNGSNFINKFIRTFVRHLFTDRLVMGTGIATPNEVVHSAITYTKFLTDQGFLIAKVKSWHPERTLRIRSILDLLIVIREFFFKMTMILPQPYCGDKLLIIAYKR